MGRGGRGREHAEKKGKRRVKKKRKGKITDREKGRNYENKGEL